MPEVFDEIKVVVGRLKPRKRKFIWIACPKCKKERWLQKDSLKDLKYAGMCNYCKAPRGKKHPMWRGGRNLNGQGYVKVWAHGHPLARKNGYILEHRLVAAEKWGIFAVMDAIVHHIDGDILNNSPDNLELFENNSHHLSQHRGPDSKMRKYNEENYLISCECGCGKGLLRFNKRGVPRKYIHGHNDNKQRS